MSTTDTTPQAQDLSVQAFAKEARLHLRPRDTKEDPIVWVMTDNAPSWVEALVYDAHGDMLPDDYRYKFIVNALNLLSEYDDADAARDAIEPDVYTSNLTAWFASHNERLEYLTSAVKSTGIPDAFNLLQFAQAMEREEVFDSVLASLEQRLMQDLPR